MNMSGIFKPTSSIGSGNTNTNTNSSSSTNEATDNNNSGVAVEQDIWELSWITIDAFCPSLREEVIGYEPPLPNNNSNSNSNNNPSTISTPLEEDTATTQIPPSSTSATDIQVDTTNTTSSIQITTPTTPPFSPRTGSNNNNNNNDPIQPPYPIPILIQQQPTQQPANIPDINTSNIANI